MHSQVREWLVVMARRGIKFRGIRDRTRIVRFQHPENRVASYSSWLRVPRIATTRTFRATIIPTMYFSSNDVSLTAGFDRTDADADFSFAGKGPLSTPSKQHQRVPERYLRECFCKIYTRCYRVVSFSGRKLQRAAVACVCIAVSPGTS